VTSNEHNNNKDIVNQYKRNKKTYYITDKANITEHIHTNQ